MLLKGASGAARRCESSTSARPTSREPRLDRARARRARSSCSTRARPVASGELFTTVGGFAKAFLDAGASAFVSCLWSVQEQPARVFVEKLYEELLKGTPMSRASALARAAARDADDPTWLAYVVYARPDAVLETV